MAKPDAEITVKLEPEIMELLRDMVARIEALEQAMAPPSGDWLVFMVKCHACDESSLHDSVDEATAAAEAHAKKRRSGKQARHLTYVSPVVRT